MNEKISQELQTAMKAAREAGKVMDRYQQNSIDVKERKNNYNDIVTEADLECQRKIVETISSSFPEDGFMAEEEGLHDEGERTWVIDPIDGTRNFQKRRKYYCVSIALKDEKGAKIGVVHSPSSGIGVTYYAFRDGGAYRSEGIDNWRESERLEVSDQDLRGAVGMTILSSRNSSELSDGLKLTEELIGEKGADFRIPGSAALELCEIAQGTLDFKADIINEWDYAAGNLIVDEAGGFTQVYDYSEEYSLAVASNSMISDEFRSVLEKKIRQS